MPILLMTFSTPLPSAFTRFRTAFSALTPGTRPALARFSTDSMARYGFTAAAP